MTRFCQTLIGTFLTQKQAARGLLKIFKSKEDNLMDLIMGMNSGSSFDGIDVIL